MSCERFRAVACSRGRAEPHRALTGREENPMVAEHFSSLGSGTGVGRACSTFGAALGSGGASLQDLTGCLTCGQVVVVAACLCQCLNLCVSDSVSVCLCVLVSLSLCLCFFERGAGGGGGGYGG